LHNAQERDEKLTVIWLSKYDPKALAVTQVLDISGFADFGLILDALGKSAGSLNQ
jgi:hypothetical protein